VTKVDKTRARVLGFEEREVASRNRQEGRPMWFTAEIRNSAGTAIRAVYGPYTLLTSLTDAIIDGDYQLQPGDQIVITYDRF
jgi:hypothetical protein